MLFIYRYHGKIPIHENSPMITTSVEAATYAMNAHHIKSTPQSLHRVKIQTEEKRVRI